MDEKKVEVVKQALEVVGTMKEGLTHIQTQINEGQFEQAVFLFQDVMVGYATVERSLMPISEKVEQGEKVSGACLKVRDSLEKMVTSFENKLYGNVKEQIQFTGLPRLSQLQEEITRTFSSFLVS